MKIPEPITDPTTTHKAAVGPNTLGSSFKINRQGAKDAMREPRFRKKKTDPQIHADERRQD